MITPKMKTALALFLFVIPVLAFSEVKIGMSEAELIALKGKPAGKTVVGTKSIYRWADMQVKLEDGQVVHVIVRDEAMEKAMDEQRRKNIAVAAEQKKALAAKEAALRAAAVARTRISDARVSEQLRQEAAREAERLKKERIEKAAAVERTRMRRY